MSIVIFGGFNLKTEEPVRRSQSRRRVNSNCRCRHLNFSNQTPESSPELEYAASEITEPWQFVLLFKKEALMKTAGSKRYIRAKRTGGHDDAVPRRSATACLPCQSGGRETLNAVERKNRKPTDTRRAAARPDVGRPGPDAAPRRPWGEEAPSRHYICPVPASTPPTLFDALRFTEDLKPRVDGRQRPVAHAINRSPMVRSRNIGQPIRAPQARRGRGTAVVDQPKCHPQAPCPRSREAGAASPWRMRQVRESRIAPELLAQPAQETTSTCHALRMNGAQA